jgi:hypothetical protein
MSCSLIGADRRTHVKVVAVALAAAGVMNLVMVGIAARHVESDARLASARTDGSVVKVGKQTIAAAGAAIMR